jgi:hypothetical protein
MLAKQALYHVTHAPVNDAGAVYDQKTSKYFVRHGRIHGRIPGCKRSLLKVREQEIQREAWWGSGGIWRLRE